MSQNSLLLAILQTSINVKTTLSPSAEAWIRSVGGSLPNAFKPGVLNNVTEKKAGPQVTSSHSRDSIDWEVYQQVLCEKLYTY